MSIPTVDELDKMLDVLSAECAEPTIITVDCPHGGSVYFGIAGGSGFVSNAGQEPYFATIGDTKAKGYTNFDVQGHDTEISNRHLIPLNLARQVLREYFLTGIRLAAVEWEEL